MTYSIFTSLLPTAAIETSNVIFYSSYSPRPQEPHSAITQLIQGLYQIYPERALKLLRRPIILNHTPSLLCRGMISIAGKRYRIDIDYFERMHHQTIIPIVYHSSHTLSPEPLSPLPSYMDIQEWVKSPPILCNTQKKVRSVLMNQNKCYLMSAENEATSNKTLHSEVVLLQKYYAFHQQGFSLPTTLMTNLQSCKMCAAMWWHMHSDPWKNLQSIYSHPELGPSARDTILTSGGNWRRSISNNQQELYQVFEHSLIERL